MNDERIAAIAAVLVFGLVLYQACMLLDELLTAPGTPAERADNLHPAPWEVSALLEEARKITEEAGDDV